MRKYTKIIVVGSAIAALAAPSAALANSSQMTPNGPTGTMQGSAQGGKDNQSVTQYKATYTDPVYGPVSCSGTHHAATKTTLAFDSFTCKSTNGTLQGVTPGQAISLPSGYWWTSDFNGTSTTYKLSGTVSADGTSYTAIATYSG
jgi:hypothetical protein